ncbi:TIGR02300 family protein [Roseomonas chloroacetimidivorans]|jgi:uncharacterized protein (TIGR02300 family)|uniref:TIGR02300 family protein n=1 Tax=Roseomonas chloroacetimidivorans TaxID=1766656 RepID=UPI003C76FBB0
MALAELGLKRTCVACGARFYDLTRTPAVCPKCGTEQPAEQPRARRAAPPPEEKVRKRAVVVEGAETDDIEVDDADPDVADDLDDADDPEEDLGEELDVETREDDEER